MKETVAEEVTSTQHTEHQELVDNKPEETKREEELPNDNPKTQDHGGVRPKTTPTDQVQTDTTTGTQQPWTLPRTKYTKNKGQPEPPKNEHANPDNVADQ